MTRWHRKEKIRINGVLREFTRRRLRAACKCAHCNRLLTPGALYWGRGRVRIHIWCFEEMQRGYNQRTRHAGGRPKALDADKIAAIIREKEKADELGRPVNVRTMAKGLLVSEATIRRFLNSNSTIQRADIRS